jgi:hypothetical protein
VYYADWDPVANPDYYGFAHLWAPGETVVIPAEEIAVEATPAPSKRTSRYDVEPVAEIEDGIEEAEVAQEPPAEATETYPERRRSGVLVVRGQSRELGTIDRATGGFVPGPDFWR